MKFNDTQEMAEFLIGLPHPSYAVIDASDDFYLIFGAEDDDAYQGVPREVAPDDEGETTDSNNGSLDAFPGMFPVRLLVPESPVPPEADRRTL